MKKRIFYANITHRCNNHCKYCFDVHSYNGQNRDMSLSQISSILKNYCVGKEDRFIINGGEPTMHPYFKEILSSVETTGCETVMYSNGRLLFNIENIKSSVIEKLQRLTIPLHGDSIIHDDICQRPGAFDETIKSILYLQRNGVHNLELKIIVNDLTVQKNVDFIKLLKDNGIIINNLAGTVLTKMVDCDTSKMVLKQDNYKTNESSFTYVNHTLKLFLMTDCHYIKLLDFPLCKLDSNIKKRLKNVTSVCEDNTFSEFWVFDSTHPGRMIDYNINSCIIFDNKQSCSEYPLCSSILKSYYVLTYDRVNNNWYYGLE